GLPNDSSVAFLPQAVRTLPVRFAEGESESQEIVFQTGTTAGTITLTLSAGAYSEQQTVLIPPAPPGIASAKAARAASSAQVEITGYDNTRSAGQLSFTFYDRNGVAVPPGAIKVDASAAFGRHFESSDVGGSFLLQAIFPVAGSIDLLDAVQVELTNSSGVARTARLRLQPEDERLLRPG
ncbi:MAG: hypothetical protein M1436_10500, partial [Acidobacteria bacterium]|nr:hypothetical protein [Acidobacteriota bacterium]